MLRIFGEVSPRRDSDPHLDTAGGRNAGLIRAVTDARLQRPEGKAREIAGLTRAEAHRSQVSRKEMRA